MKTFAKILGIAVGALLLIGIIVAIANPTKTTSAGVGPQATVAALPSPLSPTTPVAAPAPGPATSVGDGTYEVGVDVVAGTFKTVGPDQNSIIPMCYWERARDSSGQFGSIISNDNITGPGILTTKKGEFLKLTGGCTWTLR